MGRGAVCVHRVEARLARAAGGRAPSILPGAPRWVQSAAALRVPRVAQDRDRQDSKICASVGTRRDSGMSAGRGAVEFEIARLEAFLKSFFRGENGPLQVDRIPGGQSNPTFFVTLGERRLVLRKQPPGELLPSAHAVDREYRIMTALAVTKVPVPKTILFCPDRSVVGTPFYLMQRLEGRVFGEYTLPGVARGERRLMYASFAETLAHLHNLDPAAIGLADYGKAGNYFQRQIARWTRQWQLSRTRPNAHVERLIDWLRG